jgi:WD40 repeat protein
MISVADAFDEAVSMRTVDTDEKTAASSRGPPTEASGFINGEGVLERRWSLLRKLIAQNISLESDVRRLTGELNQARDPTRRFGNSDTSTTTGIDGPTRGLPAAPASHIFRGHRDAVESLSLHPLEPVVASGSSDGTTRLWDLETRKQSGIIRGVAAVAAVAFEPIVGELVAVATEQVVRLYSSRGGGGGGGEPATMGGAVGGRQGGPPRPAQLPSGSPKGVPPSRGLAASGAAFDIPPPTGAGEMTCTRTLRGHDDIITALAWIPNIAAAAAATSAASSASPAKRVSDATIGGSASVPPSTQLATAARDGEVRIWDVANGGALIASVMVPFWVRTIAASLFAPPIASLVGSGVEGAVPMTARGGGELLTARGGASPSGVGPDGTLLTARATAAGSGTSAASGLSQYAVLAVAGSDETVHVYSLVHGRLVCSKSLSGFHTNAVQTVAFSHGGVVDLNVRNAGATSAGLIAATQRILGESSATKRTSSAPPGKYLISGGRDNNIFVFDWYAGLHLATFDSHENWVRQVAFAPTGRHVISCSDDGTIRVFDLALGVSAAAAFALATGKGGSGSGTTTNAAAATAEFEARRRASEVQRIAGAHDHFVSCLAVDATLAGGRPLYVSGSADTTVKVWGIKVL